MWFALASAFAGDVWIEVDDGGHHVEVPAVWMVGAEEPSTVKTAKGTLDLDREVATLATRPVGTRVSYALATGSLVLSHREEREPATALEVTSGAFTLSMALEPDTLSIAAGSIDLDLDGAKLHANDPDVLGPLRRAGPVVLYQGATPKGRPVVLALR